MSQDLIGQAQPLLTIRQFSEKYPAFNQGGLRHLIFHENTNGFKKCVRRIGRKVLLHVPSVFAWVDEKNEIKNSRED